VVDPGYKARTLLSVMSVSSSVRHLLGMYQTQRKHVIFLKTDTRETCYIFKNRHNGIFLKTKKLCQSHVNDK